MAAAQLTWMSETDLGNAKRPKLLFMLIFFSWKIHFPGECHFPASSCTKTCAKCAAQDGFCPEHSLLGECEGPMENTCAQGQRETFFTVHLHVFLDFPLTNAFRH